MKSVTYNFTLIPTKLMIILDNKLKSLLFIILNQYSAFKKEDEDFKIIYDYISVFSDLSKKEVLSGLDIFQQIGLIKITNANEKECTFVIDYNKIIEFDTLSFKDCINKDNKIRLSTISEIQEKEEKLSIRDNLLNSIKGLNL